MTGERISQGSRSDSSKARYITLHDSVGIMFHNHKHFSSQVKEQASRTRRMAHRLAGMAMVYNLLGLALFGVAIYVAAHFISKFW